MSCVICGTFGPGDPDVGIMEDDGVCPRCERQGFEQLICGCTSDPRNYMTVDPACKKHTACVGLHEDCTGLAVDGRELCAPCRRADATDREQEPITYESSVRR